MGFVKLINMKIIYFSATCISDAEFPLIREFFRKGIDVEYYVPLLNINLRSGLFDIKKQIPRTGILKASDYPEMSIYKNYIDLNKINIVNLTDHRIRSLSTIYIWVKLYFLFLKKKPDIIHIGWPLRKLGKILYYLPFRKIITIHDPFKHSSNLSSQEEKERMLSFKKADKICLLNEIQKMDFCDYYKIPSSKIVINKLGSYDVMNGVDPINPHIKSPYILFFGLISGYKGLEYLCEAMLDIHKYYPDVKLVIAGGGKLYFDYSKYEKLSYIVLINKYQGIQELSGLLDNCLFTVCPYKDATQSGVVQTAFTRGVPVIATNVGALAKSVTDGVTGIVIPPKNTKAITDSCCKLLSSPEMLNRMRSNIKKLWQPKMEWSAIADKYIQYYREMCKE